MFPHETTSCILTGCTAVIHDAGVISSVHGDLMLTVNNITGGLHIFLGGIGRAKDGRMHCVTYAVDATDIPEGHINVTSVVQLPLSRTGYGQITFAQGTVTFGNEVLEMLDKWFPESRDRILHLYQSPVIIVT